MDTTEKIMSARLTKAFLIGRGVSEAQALSALRTASRMGLAIFSQNGTVLTVKFNGKIYTASA